MFDKSLIEKKMHSALSIYEKNITSLRVGVARADFLDPVKISIEEQFFPLKSVAIVNVADISSLIITPFDKQNIKDITRSIQDANLGVGIISEGSNIRITMPKVTEERRKELVKLLHKYMEECKVSIRNIRRDFMDEIKKSKQSKDEQKRSENEVQKITDDFIKKIEDLSKKKEIEIMKI